MNSCCPTRPRHRLTGASNGEKPNSQPGLFLRVASHECAGLASLVANKLFLPRTKPPDSVQSNKTSDRRSCNADMQSILNTRLRGLHPRVNASWTLLLLFAGGRRLPTRSSWATALPKQCRWLRLTKAWGRQCRGVVLGRQGMVEEPGVMHTKGDGCYTDGAEE